MRRVDDRQPVLMVDIVVVQDPGPAREVIALGELVVFEPAPRVVRLRRPAAAEAPIEGDDGRMVKRTPDVRPLDEDAVELRVRTQQLSAGDSRSGQNADA